MKKAGKCAAVFLFAAAFLAAAWLAAYRLAKHADNLPSLAAAVERGDEYVQSELRGYLRNQLISVWGKPDSSAGDGQEEIWPAGAGTGLAVRYGRGKKKVSSAFVVVRFHDHWFPRAELSEETVEWLSLYNSLPKESQDALNYVPSEITSRIRDGSERAVETDAAESAAEPETGTIMPSPGKGWR